MRPNFVGQIRIDTTSTSLTVEWDPPYRGADIIDRYIVRLRNLGGKNVPQTKRVLQSDAELSVTYEDLIENGTYKVAVRGRGEKPGRWIVTTVVLGENPPALPDSHYMYQIPAGEPTPDDAMGQPTRHVRLENGVWTPFDPAREYKANQMWWWYNQLDEYEEKVEITKDALDEWNEANPDSPIEHPVLAFEHQLAVEGVQNIRNRIVAEEKQIDEEVKVKFPPEEYTQDQVRWVQRPKQRR